MTTVLPFPAIRSGEELHAPYSNEQAEMEANRCLYCSDAPCMQACPTHIDIAGFIKKISSGNLTGAGIRILEDNFLGGTCARVCPVEELCQGACVMNEIDKPIEIGRLQRHATDHLTAKGIRPFAAGEATGKRVLVVGSGPAGLSAAAELAKDGHEVTVWERSELAGGLSTYGIITLREPIEIAQQEVDMVRDLGVTVHTSTELRDADHLREVAEEYDAVFLAVGMGAVPPLSIPGAEHIRDGLEFIADFKTGGEQPAPTSAVVIGAGNTAIDAATTARQMGARSTIVYRRTPEQMTAFDHEYEFATDFGIEFQFLAAPKEVLLDADGAVTGLRCERMVIDESGRPTPSGEPDLDLACDVIISAIGQEKLTEETGFGLDLERGYVDTGTNLQAGARDVVNVFAGGDVVRAEGDASTVMAVQDGKIAARTITSYLKEA